MPVPLVVTPTIAAPRAATRQLPPPARSRRALTGSPRRTPETASPAVRSVRGRRTRAAGPHRTSRTCTGACPGGGARCARGTARGRQHHARRPGRGRGPSLRAGRVGALERLVELLRVAEQDHDPRRRRRPSRWPVRAGPPRRRTRDPRRPPSPAGPRARPCPPATSTSPSRIARSSRSLRIGLASACRSAPRRRPAARPGVSLLCATSAARTRRRGGSR